MPRLGFDGSWHSLMDLGYSTVLKWQEWLAAALFWREAVRGTGTFITTTEWQWGAEWVTIRGNEHFRRTLNIRNTEDFRVTLTIRRNEHFIVTVTNLSLSRQCYQYVYWTLVSCELLNSLTECPPQCTCTTLVCCRFRQGVQTAVNKFHYRC